MITQVKKNVYPTIMSGLAMISGLFVLSVSTFSVSAQATKLITTANTLSQVVDIATGIVIAIAFLVFFWHLVSYIKNDEAGKKGEIAGNMVKSLIVIVVITSLWGIVKFVTDIVGIEDTTSPGNITVPEFSRNR